MKVACTVWRRGKERDNIKFLPIPILINIDGPLANTVGEKIHIGTEDIGLIARRGFIICRAGIIILNGTGLLLRMQLVVKSGKLEITIYLGMLTITLLI